MDEIGFIRVMQVHEYETIDEMKAFKEGEAR
jgi:hypothetical protein